MKSCDTCLYHYPCRSGTGSAIIRCRRYPPTSVEQKYSTNTSEFPIVLPDWWCGEFKHNDKLTQTMVEYEMNHG